MPCCGVTEQLAIAEGDLVLRTRDGAQRRWSTRSSRMDTSRFVFLRPRRVIKLPRPVRVVSSA